MRFDLEGKIFSAVQNTANGDSGTATLFFYHQDGDLVWADYSGGSIEKGHLIARVVKGGLLDMRYHHLNTKAEFKLGKCISTPVLLPDGRVKFEERWQWLTGDRSKGYSEIEEVWVDYEKGREILPRLEGQG